VHFDAKPLDWLSMLIGGLNQVRRGEWAGRLWMLGWFLLGIMSLLFAGTTIGSAFLGLLFALHLASIADIFFRQWEEVETRVRFTVIAALLLGGVYWGTSSLIGQHVRSLQFSGLSQDLGPDQVLWYFPNVDCNVGDIAFYETPRTTLAGRIGGQAAQFQVRGNRVNRVIAKAGQRVQWDGKQFFVDGIVSPWQPGPNMGNFAPFELQVLTDCLYVIPENLVDLDQYANLRPGGIHGIETVGIVPQKNVQGRIFFRSFPITRMRWFPPASG
jgi:hypothetical protein